MASGDAGAVADGELARLPIVALARIAAHLNERDVAMLAKTCRALRHAQGVLSKHASPAARAVAIESAAEFHCASPTILLGRGGRYAMYLKMPRRSMDLEGPIATIHDLESKRMLWRIDVHRLSPQVMFVPGSATLLVVRPAREPHTVYDVASREVVRTVDAPHFDSSLCAVNGDATAFAWFERDPSRLLVTRGGTVTHLHLPPYTSHIMAPMAFNRDSSRLAGVRNGTELCEWDTATGELLRVVPCEARDQRSFNLAYSDDDALLLLVGERGVAIVDAPTWEQTTIYARRPYVGSAFAVFRGGYVFVVYIIGRLSPTREWLGHRYHMEVVVIHTKTLQRHHAANIIVHDAQDHGTIGPTIRSIAFARDGSRAWLAGESNDMIELRTGRLARFLAE